MPHAKPADLPNAGGGRWPASKDHFRSVQWGDLEVGYTTTEHPLDTTELNGDQWRVILIPVAAYFVLTELGKFIVRRLHIEHAT